MKTFQILLVISFIVAIFVSSGLVSALDSNGASVYTIWSSQAVKPGDRVTIRITFQSNTDEQIQVQQIGINFDWMASGSFYGNNLSDNPVTIPSNGSYTFNPFMIQIPTNASVGPHSYFVGVDGLEGTGSTSFSWDSPTSTIIVYGSNQTTQFTPTPSSNTGGGGQTSSSQSLLLFAAIVVIVVVVVLSILVMTMRKNRKQLSPVADQQPNPVVEQSSETPS